MSSKKKEVLIHIITQLQDKRDLAAWIVALLETTDVNNATIDALISILHQAIQTMVWEEEKWLLEKSLQQIKKIQEMEALEKESEEDIDKILDEII